MQDVEYAAAVEAIYGAAHDPATWPRALTATADYVGGLGAMLARHDLRTGAGSLVVGRLSEASSDLYVRRYIRNPHSVASVGRPVGVAAPTSSFTDVEAVRRTAFYADMMIPQRIADFTVMTHASLTGGDELGGISVAMTAVQAEDGVPAARRLNRLGPHLTRAIDLSLATEGLRDAARHGDTLLDALPTAAFVLNERGTVERANPKGEALLLAGDGLTAAGDGTGRLAASVTAEAGRLARLIGRAFAVAAGGDGAFEPVLRLPRPSGAAPYVLVATPLPPAAFARLDAVARGARVLLQVLDPAERLRTDTALLQTALGLTAAEAKVSTLIASGLAVPAAAAALRLSANTVRTHLARTFEKTGARSQSALTRLVARLPHPPHPIE